MDLLGQKIGQIRIEALIGRGGMGLVYRGFDDKLKRHVAIKVLREDHGFHREARARFIREARILSRLDHPGICKVYDLVDHAGAELLAGRELGEALVARFPGLPEGEALVATLDRLRSKIAP